MESKTILLQKIMSSFEDYALYDPTDPNQQILLRTGYIERHCMPTPLAWAGEEHRVEFLMRTVVHASDPYTASDN